MTKRMKEMLDLMPKNRGETSADGKYYNGGSVIYVKGNGKWSCPVCGTFTLDEPEMNYECDVCGWEDDSGQDHPDTCLGENPISFNRARLLWEKYHDNYHNHRDEWGTFTFGFAGLDEWIATLDHYPTGEEILEYAKAHSKQEK